MNNEKKTTINKKVKIRNEEELKFLRKSGKIAALTLKKVLNETIPGKSLKELDQLAESKILKLGGKPAFKTVPQYSWTTCLTVNDEVVHGIPSEYILKEGDVLGIDLGVVYEGWYTDVAWSKLVQSSKLKIQNGEEKKKFLEAGEVALEKAIAKAIESNRIGDISSAIQESIEASGYAVVKSLSGHGVGESYHEEPEVPGFGTAGKGLALEEGMVLAIEVIYTAGNGGVYQKADGWTLASVEGGLGGLFEMTVIVKKDKAEIITDWRKI